MNLFWKLIEFWNFYENEQKLFNWKDIKRIYMYKTF